MNPALSFKELHRLIALLRPHLLGARCDRVFVPEAKGHPEGFLKKEWVISLYGNGKSQQLILSLRPQRCGMVWTDRELLAPAKRASRSGFDLSLSKSVVGAKLTKVETAINDRVVILEFTGSETFELQIHLVPSRPFAVLLNEGKLIAASDLRTEHTAMKPRELTTEQLAKIPDRVELVSNLQTYSELWWKARHDELRGAQITRIQQYLNDAISSIQQKIKSLDEQWSQSKNEPDWSYFGKLLQIHLHEKPKPIDGHYLLLDYEKDENVAVPADPKMNLEANLNRLFHLAKRKEKRIEESNTRLESLRERLSLLDAKRKKLESNPSDEALQELMKDIGVSEKTPLNKEQKKWADFSGRQAQSKEGLTILVGRNRTENLELTFKIARGNDIWLHLKGKPSSHAVIILPPKRSASLDTLLDAAHLCILMSGGKDWGKTEVDYTYRKYVKKIKGSSTEASYSQQKTLVVALDPERVKRLYQTP